MPRFTVHKYDSQNTSLSGGELARNSQNKLHFGLTTSGLPECEEWIMNELASRWISATDAGLVEGCRMIRRSAIPLTPRDTGHLRSSSYILAKKLNSGVVKEVISPKLKNSKRTKDVAMTEENFSDAKMDIVKYKESAASVGFAAGYANIVHDASPFLNWKVGGPKFLQRAVENNIGKIISVIIQKSSMFFSVPKEWKKKKAKSKNVKKP